MDPPRFTHQLSSSPPRSSSDPFSPSSPSGPIRNRHRQYNPYGSGVAQPSQAPTSSLARRRRQSAMGVNGGWDHGSSAHGNQFGGNNNGNGGLDDMAKVEQALTLLSLHPENPAPQAPPTTPAVSESVPWPPHPSPEALLGNAIRTAVRALCDIRASQALVTSLGYDLDPNSVQRQDSEHSLASMSSSVASDDDHVMNGMSGGSVSHAANSRRQLSIEEIMQGYEKGIQGVEEVSQTIAWVQLWLKEERDAWREKLLK